MDDSAQIDMEKEIERRVAEQLRIRLEAAAAAAVPPAPQAEVVQEDAEASGSDSESSASSEAGEVEKLFSPNFSSKEGEGNLFSENSNEGVAQIQSCWEKEFDEVAGDGNGIVVGSAESFTIATFPTQREDGRCVGPASRGTVKGAPETFADVQLGFYSARQLVVLPEQCEVESFDSRRAPTERSLTCIEHRFEVEAADAIERVQQIADRNDSSDESSDDGTPSSNDDDNETTKTEMEGTGALQGLLEYAGDSSAPERVVSLVRESIELDDPFVLNYKASKEDMPSLKVGERCPYVYESLMVADGQSNKKSPFQKPVSAVSLFNNGTVLKIDVDEIGGALHQQYGRNCDPLHVCFAVYSLSTSEKKAPATKLSDDFWLLTDSEGFVQKSGADFNNLKTFVVFIPEEYRRTPLVLLCRVLRSVGGGNSVPQKPAANSNVTAVDYSNNYYVTSQNSLDMSNFDNVVDFYQRPHKYHSHFENNTSKGEPCSILKQENQQLAMMVGQIQQELGWCVFELNVCLAGKTPNYAQLTTGSVECYGLYRGCPSNPSPYTASSSLPIQLDTKQVVDFILNQYIASPMKLGKPASATVKAAPEVASAQVSTTAASHGLKLVPISISLKVTDVTPFNVVGGSKASSSSGIQYDISFPSAGLPEETESLAVVREEPTFIKGTPATKAKDAQSKTQLCRFCPSPLLILNSGYFNAYHNVYYVRLSSLTLSKFFTFQQNVVKTSQSKKKLPPSHTTFAVQVSLKESDEGGFEDSEGMPVIYGKNLSESFFETSAYSTAMSGAGPLVDSPILKGADEPKMYFSQDEIKLQLPPKLTALHHLFFTFYAVDTTTATSAMTAIAKKAPTDSPSGPLPRFIKIGYSVLPLKGNSNANHALFAKDNTSLPLILPENAHALGADYLSKLAVSKSRYDSAVSEVDVSKTGEVTTQGGVPSAFASNGAPCIHFSAIPRSTVFATSSNLSATLNSMQTTLPLIVKHFDAEFPHASGASPSPISPLIASPSYDSIFIDQLRGIGSNLSLPEVLAYYPALSSYHMSVIACTSNTSGSNGIVSLAVRKIALRTLLKVVQMVHQYDSNTRIQFRRVGHQQSTLMHAGKVVTTTVVNTLYTYFSNDVLYTDGKYLFPVAQGLGEVWLSELDELEKASPNGKNPNPVNSTDKDRELHRQRLVDFSWFLLDSILRSMSHTLDTFARKNADSSKPTSSLRQGCFPDSFYSLLTNLLVAVIKSTSSLSRSQVVLRVASFLRQLFVFSMPKRVRDSDNSSVVAAGVGLDRGRILESIHAVMGFLCKECGYTLSAVNDLTTLEKGANLPSSSNVAGCLQVQSFVRTVLNSVDAYLLFTPIPSNYFPALMMRAILPHILHPGSLEVRSGALKLLNETIGFLIGSALRFGSPTEGGGVGSDKYALAQSNLRSVVVGSTGPTNASSFFNSNTLYGSVMIFMCRNWKEIIAANTAPKTSSSSTSSASKRAVIGNASDRRQAALIALWTVFTGGMGNIRAFVRSLVMGPSPRTPSNIPQLFFISESEPLRKHVLAGMFQLFSDAQSSFRHAHYSSQKEYYSIAVARQRALAGVITGSVVMRKKRGTGENEVQGEDDKITAMLNATPYSSPRVEVNAGKSKKPAFTADTLLIPLLDSSLSTVVSCIGAVVGAVGLVEGSDWLHFGLSGYISDPSVVSSEGGAPYIYPFFILLEGLVSILNNSISLTVGSAVLHCATVKLLPHLISKRATYFPGVLLLLSRLLSFAVCAVDSTHSSEGGTQTNLVDVFYKSQLRRIGAGSSTAASRIVMHRGGVSRLIAARSLAEVVRRYTRLIGGGGSTESECIEYLTKLQPTLSTAFVTVAESRGRNLKVASRLVESALADVVTILQYLERRGSASVPLPEGYWSEYCRGYQTAVVSESSKTKSTAVKGSRLLVLDESSGSEKPVLPLPLSVVRGSVVIQDIALKVAKPATEAAAVAAEEGGDGNSTSVPATPVGQLANGLFDNHVDPLEFTPIAEGSHTHNGVSKEGGVAMLPALPDGFQEAIPSILGLFRAVLRLQYDEVLQVSMPGADNRKSSGALLQQIHKGVAYWSVISAFLGGKDSEDGAHQHESRRMKLVEMPPVSDPASPYTSIRQIAMVHPGKHLGVGGVGSVTCASLQQSLKWLQKLYELHLGMSTSTDTSGNSNAEAAVTLLSAASVAFKVVECFYDTVDVHQRQCEATRSNENLPAISLPSAFLPPAILSHVFWHDYVRILPDLQAAGHDEGVTPLLPVLRAIEVGGTLKTPLHLLVERELHGVWAAGAQQQVGGTVSASSNPLLSMLFSGCSPSKSSAFTFTASLFTTYGQQYAVSTAADLFLAAADGKGKKDENASLYRRTAIQALHLASTIAAARRDHTSASTFHQKLSKLYGAIDKPLSTSDQSKQHRFYLVFARMSVDPVPLSSTLRVLFKVFLRNVYVKRRLKKLLAASTPEEARDIVEAEVDEFAYGLVEEYLRGARRLQSKYLPSPGLLKVFKVPAEVEKSKMEKNVAIPLVLATAPSLKSPILDPAVTEKQPADSSSTAIVLVNDNLDDSSEFPLDDLATHFYYAYLNHITVSAQSKSARRSKAPVVPDTILNSETFVGAGGGPELESLLDKLHRALAEEKSYQQDPNNSAGPTTTATTSGQSLADCGESTTMSMSSMSFTASGAAGSKKRRNKDVLYRLVRDAGRVFQNKMENLCTITVCEVYPKADSEETVSSGFVGSFECQLHVGLDKIHRPSSRANKGNSLALAKASTGVNPQDQRLEDRVITISRTFPTTTTVGEVVAMQVRETDCMGTALSVIGKEISSVRVALLDLQAAMKAGPPSRSPVMGLLQKLHTSLLSPMSISPPGEYYKQVIHRLVKTGAMPKAAPNAVAEVRAVCEEYISGIKLAMDEVLTTDSSPKLVGPSVMEKAPEVCAQVFKAMADMEVALLTVA